MTGKNSIEDAILQVVPHAIDEQMHHTCILTRSRRPTKWLYGSSRLAALATGAGDGRSPVIAAPVLAAALALAPALAAAWVCR